MKKHLAVLSVCACLALAGCGGGAATISSEGTKSSSWTSGNATSASSQQGNSSMSQSVSSSSSVEDQTPYQVNEAEFLDFFQNTVLNSTLTITQTIIHDEKPTEVVKQTDTYWTTPTLKSSQSKNGGDSDNDIYYGQMKDGVYTAARSAVNNEGTRSAESSYLQDNDPNYLAEEYYQDVYEILFLYEEDPVNAGNDNSAYIFASLRKFYRHLTYQASDHSYVLPTADGTALGFKRFAIHFQNKQVVSLSAYYRFSDYYDGLASRDFQASFSAIGTTSVSLDADVTKALSFHTVSFYSDDGTTLLGKAHAMDGNAAYVGFPIKKAAVDSAGAYRFKAWDKTFDNVTADMTVTASFDYVANADLYDFDSATGTLSLKQNSTNYVYPTSLILPDTFNNVAVTCFDFGAFYFSPSLVSLTLNPSLTDIKTNLSGLTCDTAVALNGNTHFALKGSSLYSADGTTLYSFNAADAVADVTLPDGLKDIRACAFQNLPIVSISLPSTLESIGESAFKSTQLTSVVLPEGVNSVGNQAFDAVYSLESAVLPESLTALPDYLFNRDLLLSSLSVSSKLASIGDYAFGGCASLTAFDFADTLTYLGMGAFMGTGLTSVRLSAKDVYYAENLFQDCSSLTSVYIPKQVTILGSYTFSGASSLKDVVFEDVSTLEKLGEGTFMACSSLTTLDLGGSKLNTLRYGAFRNDSALTSLVLPATLSVVEGQVFDGDASLSIYLMATSEPVISDNWNQIDSTNNTTAPYYLYSESKPASNPTHYWHYVDNIPTVYAA